MLNAAAALYVAGAVSNMGNGVLRARESIDSGRAARILAGMVEVTNELVEARR